MAKFTQKPQSIEWSAFTHKQVLTLMLLLFGAMSLTTVPLGMIQHESHNIKHDAAKAGVLPADKIVELSTDEIVQVSGGVTASSALRSLMMSFMTPIGNGAFVMDIAGLLVALNKLAPPKV